MKKSILILVVLLGLSIYLETASEEIEFNFQDYLISDQQIKAHIKKLSSDEFFGRAVGTIGEELSSNYIAKALSDYQIKPLGDKNYFQFVPMQGLLALESTKLCIYNKGKCEELKMYEDYLVYKSGITTFIPKPLEMIFVGYGITAPEFDYDDYYDLDVTGKIVVFIGGEPYSEDPAYFNGRVSTIYSSPEAKQRLALARGAFGSIYVPSPDEINTQYWYDLSNDLKFEFVTLAYTVSDNLSISMNPTKCKILFEGSKYSLNDVYDMYKDNNLHSFSLEAKLEYRGVYQTREFIGRNVIGMIEGSDPELKDTYIILSAHYDHLGIGPEIAGDSIYNGLLDNALGCSALLEVARLINKNKSRLKRSVIILFVTGEEKGLLGSRYYTDHPKKQLYKTIANINIDGVAYIDEFNSIIPIGSNYSTMDKFIEQTAIDNNLRVDFFPYEYLESESFNRSDQIAFAQAGIPSCMIVDGIYYRNIDQEFGIEILKDYFNNIYHTPFDDLSQPINYKAVMQHIDFILDLTFNLSNSEIMPIWKEGNQYLNERLRTQTEKR